MKPLGAILFPVTHQSTLISGQYPREWWLHLFVEFYVSIGFEHHATRNSMKFWQLKSNGTNFSTEVLIKSGWMSIVSRGQPNELQHWTSAWHLVGRGWYVVLWFRVISRTLQSLCGSEIYIIWVKHGIRQSYMDYTCVLKRLWRCPPNKKVFFLQGRQILTTNNHDSKGESWSEAAIIGWVTNMVDLINPLILFMESWDKPINPDPNIVSLCMLHLQMKQRVLPLFSPGLGYDFARWSTLRLHPGVTRAAQEKQGKEDDKN